MSIRRRTFLSGLAAGAALPILSGCQVAPGTGQQSLNFYSAEDERKMGVEAHPQILAEFHGAYDDPRLQAYVAGIGSRLLAQTETPNADFRFTVLNSPIINAMALPGGFVYVTRGLLSLVGTEAELAAVVGHEIGHVLARHSANRQSQAVAANILTSVLGIAVGVPGVADMAGMGAAAYLSSYSRDQESEADRLGVRYMSRANYHPQAVVSMLAKLRDAARLDALDAGEDPETVDKFSFMATHPRTIDRVRDSIAATQGLSTDGAEGAERFQSMTDGMIYGDDPAQGVVRGQMFQHPDLGIQFEAPPEFRLTNTAKAVYARHRGGALVKLDAASWNRASDMVSYLHSLSRTITLRNVEEINVNGMAAATGRGKARDKEGDPVDVQLVAIRFGESQVFRLTFISPSSQTARWGTAFRRATYSFRALSNSERAAIQPLRLKQVSVRSGDTQERLAERMPVLHATRLERFRLLNGLQPDEPLAVGSKVRLIL